MRKIKRLIAFLLAAFFVLSMVQSVPAEAKTKYNWQYSTEEDYIYSDGQWKLQYTYSYKYNKNGDTTYYGYSSDDFSEYTKYSYDKKGRQKSAKDYGNEGQLISKRTYSFNSDDQVKTEKLYDENNKLVSTTKYKYDSKGNWTKITTTYTDKKKKKAVSKAKYKYYGDTIVKAVYTEDSGAFEYSVSTVTYTKKGVMKKYVYETNDYSFTDTYDKKGNLIKSVGKGETGSFENTYEYKNGLLVKEICKTTDVYAEDSEPIINTYTHEYKKDKHKNILETMVYMDGEPYRKEVYSGYKKFKVK